MSTTFSRGENPLKADKLNTALSERILRSGDAMTGLLKLVGNPVSAFDAATKQYVDTQVSSIVLHGGVLTFNTRDGDVVLNTTDVTTALGYIPYDAANPAGYRTASDITGALIPYAKIDSPTFTGDPRAPTPALGDADTSIATTAFVYNALIPLSSNFVTSFNTRKGAVTLTLTDVTTVLGYIPYDSANPAGYQTYAQTVATSQSVASTYVPLSQKAAALGVATLDASGKLLSSQLPSTATGTLSYKGGWNAATNTPVASSGALMGGVVQLNGSYYVVTASGTTAAIDGNTTWVAGDWITSTGTVWQRVQNSTSPYLPLTGGTLSGLLTLSADPSSPLHAATKQYTDTKLPFTGGTLTGDLILNRAPVTTLQAATKGYVDTLGTTASSTYLPLAGGTLTGNLVLNANPTTGLQAATKAYVDSQDTAVTAAYLPLTGGTLSGPLTVNADLTVSGGNVIHAGSSIMPDLAWWITGANGNIPMGLDTTGTLLVRQLQVFNGATMSNVAINNIALSGTFGFAGDLAVTGNLSTTGNATFNGQTVTLNSLAFASGDLEQPGAAIMPDLSRWVRDSAGNIVLALDTKGALIVQQLQVLGSATLTNPNLIGNLSTTGNFTAGGTGSFGGAITTPGITFTSGDLEQQSSSSIVPDLSRWVRDSAGNINFAFATNGDTIVNNLQVLGTLTAPGFSGGGGGGGSTASPADALDITRYGAVGDGNDDIFISNWGVGGVTLTVSRYTGAINWTGNILTLTDLPNFTAPGIDPNQVGKYIYIQATDSSGVITTVKIISWTNESVITVDTAAPTTITTALISWPAFLPSDAGKSIRIEGAGASPIRQSWNNGLMPWMGKITIVNAGNQVTVANTLAPTFSTANNNQPARVSWGTDNSAAYLSAQSDIVTKGVKFLWHPRTDSVAKTVYCAFSLAQRGANDVYYINPFVNAQATYMQTQWLGDASVIGVLTDISGRLMPKRIIPSRSPSPKNPTRDIIARLHMPRVVANATVNVVECGDSISKYDPTAQSDGWNPVPTWEGLMIRQNPAKTLKFQNIANIGVGWSEMVDPGSGLTWRIPGTDLYFMSSSGHNDFWRGHAIKVQAGINLGHTSGNDSGGRQPDVLLTTAKVIATWPQQQAAWNFDGRMHTEVLLRTMAKTQHLGYVDLNDIAEQVVFGASNYHRELQALPEVNNWALSTTNPFVVYADTYSWSIGVVLNGTALWSALGAFHIALSPMPGNVFIIDRDPVANVWRYEARLWGREVTTTVSTSGANITTSTGTAVTGTVTWPAFNNQMSFSAGGLTGRQGQCVLFPGGDINGQAQRTYINQVINDASAAMDDFWWGNPPGSGNATFNSSATLTFGGQVFLPVDVDAGVDVVMTWSGGEYRGKIIGFTNNNTVTLNPAPPALTNQVVQMWLGRISVPRTNGTQSATAANTTATFLLSFNRDEFSLRNTLTSTQFRGPVERYGCRFAPRFRMTGPGPVTANFTNIYVDRDVYYMPSGTPADLWSSDQNYSGGGGGYHDPSILGERITRHAYEALDLCAI